MQNSNTGNQQLSALPSRLARALAFAAILLGGAMGGVIGYGIVAVQCTGDCGTAKGIGILIGALTIAGGVAVLAVLVLRAMGEWQRVHQSAVAADKRLGRRQ